MAFDKVLYKGHAVAAVAAIDRYVADYAASKIKVEYDILDAVTNVEDATKEGAPILLDSLVGDHLGKKVKNTIEELQEQLRTAESQASLDKKDLGMNSGKYAFTCPLFLNRLSNASLILSHIPYP